MEKSLNSRSNLYLMRTKFNANARVSILHYREKKSIKFLWKILANTQYVRKRVGELT